ncbi:Glutamyl-tRNA (Gln) amidotransferase subunit C [Quillaja saponaria]|uniref:Glutamyl-tRNA (Gln) amidotransferase subunit C n=1 Tax=Quillaja saponaria TaxID=32244 RepID=A0AAD7LUH1_QUISA|nr:Glutamyl-tRNA (Gln) amidotransferase subunit C [Quillaja saponaria]
MRIFLGPPLSRFFRISTIFVLCPSSVSRRAEAASGSSKYTKSKAFLHRNHKTLNFIYALQVIMAWRFCSRLGYLPSLSRFPKLHLLPLPFSRPETFCELAPSTSKNRNCYGFWAEFQGLRLYAHGARKNYDLFGNRKPGDEEFRKTWAKEMEEDTCLWTGSEDESDDEKDQKSRLEEEIRKARLKAKEHSDLIDADDSDELRKAYPNESSDKYIDKLFEFEEMPKYRTISELLKAEEEPEELSPGKQARKLAVENALKKLKKGPDGRYTNVWEVMSDVDILIGAFENVVSGPEYEELRRGGAKKLNMQFFKDIQTRMRDPNYKFSPELKLKPKRQTGCKEEMAESTV